MPIEDPLKIDCYYQALIEKNDAYVGVFYAGVITTSVLWLSTCSAKKPKKENVVFYHSVKEALDNGFRPCKICYTMDDNKHLPSEIRNVILMVKNNPKQKFSDYQLRNKNINSEKINRWFKKNYHLTFHAYQRMYRINNAYIELKNENNKKNENNEKMKSMKSDNLYGFSYLIEPNALNNSFQKNILINKTTTPLGPMFICATEKGVCLVEFTDRRMLETEFKDLQKRLSAKIILGENKHVKQAKNEINEYFQGKRKIFDVPLDTPGTDFQRKVWEELKLIPFGTTISYQKQSELLHNPKAIRAIATANGFNRVSIIIPCHRIIGKNGNLTGYGGGLERKKWLIDFEKSNHTTNQK